MLDSPVIEAQWGVIHSTHPDQSWGPPSLLCNGYQVIPMRKAANAWP